MRTVPDDEDQEMGEVVVRVTEEGGSEDVRIVKGLLYPIDQDTKFNAIQGKLQTNNISFNNSHFNVVKPSISLCFSLYISQSSSSLHPTQSEPDIDWIVISNRQTLGQVKFCSGCALCSKIQDKVMLKHTPFRKLMINMFPSKIWFGLLWNKVHVSESHIVMNCCSVMS